MAPRILKFNSRALGSAEALRQACAIALEETPDGAVVMVSALQGYTEEVRDALVLASTGARPSRCRGVCSSTASRGRCSSS